MARFQLELGGRLRTCLSRLARQVAQPGTLPSDPACSQSTASLTRVIDFSEKGILFRYGFGDHPQTRAGHAPPRLHRSQTIFFFRASILLRKRTYQGGSIAQEKKIQEAPLKIEREETGGFCVLHSVQANVPIELEVNNLIAVCIATHAPLVATLRPCTRTRNT